MKRPRQQRAAATRDRILDTAEALFNERGYDGSSMNALAERSGASIGGLYEWFRNKEEVLIAVAERHVNQATSSILERLAASSELDIEQQIKVVLEEALAMHREKPDLHRFLYAEAPRPRALQERLRAFDEVMEKTLSSHLHTAGMSRKKADLKGALIARAGQALLHEFVLDDQLPYSYDYRLKELHATMIQLMADTHTPETI